jgi:hypothetical protein
MTNWYSGIYKAFVIASVISFIISFFSSGTVSLGSILAGYSLLILGIMMILLILFNKILAVTQGQSLFQIIYSIFSFTGPFILMLAIIGFILYLIIFYKQPITEGHVSKSYYTFSNINIILLLLQIYLVYLNIDTDKFETTGKISKVTSSLLYLLGVLTGICSIILFTILKYFRTDGFTNNI